MLIRKIAVGNSFEAYVENRLRDGLNIIVSDDNNKGKTIIIQTALYAIGNEPVFPVSFDFENYYHYVELVLDNGKTLLSCRKGNSFVTRIDDSVTVHDSVSELKRYLNRFGFRFPTIIKDNLKKMVDPVLLYQVFFVGQDAKDTSTILHNSAYYNKEDFWNLIFALDGIEDEMSYAFDQEDVKREIARLNEEKKMILSINKVLKSDSKAIESVSQSKVNTGIERQIDMANKINKSISDLKNRISRAISRKLSNERTLKEVRSLQKASSAGSLFCLDCGSDRIGYHSGDKSYSFDISDVSMRRNIIEGLQDRIQGYEEEIESCTLELNSFQKQLQEVLKNDEITLENVIIYKDEILSASDADSRLYDIEKELKNLKSKLVVDRERISDNKERKEIFRKAIIDEMNFVNKKIDPSGNNEYQDIFSKRRNAYSGVEGTVFYLSRLYAFEKTLNHKYPIIMDYFRAGELSTEKEAMVLALYSTIPNQIVFTATLKKEELGKYSGYGFVNQIDYSTNEANHILKSESVEDFRKLMEPLLLKV